MPAGEIHVQLAVNYADNRKVRALMRFGPDARLARDLYVQMLCYAKATLSDGFVPAEQIGLLVYPDPIAAGERNIDQLVQVGLIEHADGGYYVTGWLERNRTRAAIQADADASVDAGIRGNHRRWHIARGIKDPKCPLCVAGITDPIQAPESGTRSGGRFGGDDRPESTETETETETTKNSPRPAAARKPPQPGDDNDPDFAAFWDAYPKKADKGAARKAYRTAVSTRHVEPKTITAGAERYADDCATHGTAAKFIKNPATWLNAESYDNHQHPVMAGGFADPEDIWNQDD